MTGRPDRTTDVLACSPTDAMHGYLHPLYAESLSDVGEPTHLPLSDGWVLTRPIPGTSYFDAMGSYPLFCCRDWSALDSDLERLKSEIVSIVIVADPFAQVDYAHLEGCFDQVSVFKQHMVADLLVPITEIVKKSHRATVRKAERKTVVTVCENPLELLEQWNQMFGHLVVRHHITGLRAFSRDAFAKQLAIPGMVMFAAHVDGELVGLDLWYVQGDVAYGHLVAFNANGYKARASYATKWFLMHHFQQQGIRWVDFGGGAGVSGKADGLTTFKQGWSTGTRPVYLCSKVLKPDIYDALTVAAWAKATSYFPAYRKGEFS